jgi:hypothetical protein
VLLLVAAVFFVCGLLFLWLVWVFGLCLGFCVVVVVDAVLTSCFSAVLFLLVVVACFWVHNIIVGTAWVVGFCFLVWFCFLFWLCKLSQAAVGCTCCLRLMLGLSFSNDNSG